MNTIFQNLFFFFVFCFLLFLFFRTFWREARFWFIVHHGTGSREWIFYTDIKKIEHKTSKLTACFKIWRQRTSKDWGFFLLILNWCHIEFNYRKWKDEQKFSYWNTSHYKYSITTRYRHVCKWAYSKRILPVER